MPRPHQSYSLVPRSDSLVGRKGPKGLGVIGTSPENLELIPSKCEWMPRTKHQYRIKEIKLHMKHSDEVRFSFGVAAVNEEGVRLDPFKHTGKKLVLYSYCGKLVKEEMKRAKYLTSDYPSWVPSQRPEGDACLNDSPITKRRNH